MRPIELPAVPVERQRLSDNIYTQLLGEIMDGRFQVGDRLPPENQLAQQFGVSRPGLREALRRLQSDGVMVSRQQRAQRLQRNRGCACRPRELDNLPIATRLFLPSPAFIRAQETAPTGGSTRGAGLFC
jgi:DNA-binding transcriptional MocR family regulator